MKNLLLVSSLLLSTLAGAQTLKFEETFSLKGNLKEFDVISGLVTNTPNAFKSNLDIKIKKSINLDVANAAIEEQDILNFAGLPGASQIECELRLAIKLGSHDINVSDAATGAPLKATAWINHLNSSGSEIYARASYQYTVPASARDCHQANLPAQLSLDLALENILYIVEVSGTTPDKLGGAVTFRTQPGVVAGTISLERQGQTYRASKTVLNRNLKFMMTAGLFKFEGLGFGKWGATAKNVLPK